jgi:hypothetical protein
MKPEVPPFPGPLAPPAVPIDKRHPRRLKVVAVIISVVLASLAVGAVAGGVVEDNHWKPLYNAQTQTLNATQASLSSTQGLLDNLNQKIVATVGDLDHPSFVLWNTCGGDAAAGCPLQPGYEYIGGIPDTFTYNVNFRATVPVTVKVMDTSNFVCWESRNCTAHWVEWANQTTLQAVFNGAEGCAGYLAVWSSTQAGTLYPDVRVTRNPSATITGACRH